MTRKEIRKRGKKLAIELKELEKKKMQIEYKVADLSLKCVERHVQDGTLVGLFEHHSCDDCHFELPKHPKRLSKDEAALLVVLLMHEIRESNRSKKHPASK